MYISEVSVQDASKEGMKYTFVGQYLFQQAFSAFLRHHRNGDGFSLTLTKVLKEHSILLGLCHNGEENLPK